MREIKLRLIQNYVCRYVMNENAVIIIYIYVSISTYIRMPCFWFTMKSSRPEFCSILLRESVLFNHGFQFVCFLFLMNLECVRGFIDSKSMNNFDNFDRIFEFLQILISKTYFIYLSTNKNLRILDKLGRILDVFPEFL